MAIKRAFVPGAKKGKRTVAGSGTRSPVIGRVKYARSMGGKRK